MPRRTALALVCLLVLSGCSGFGGSVGGDRFSETITPVPVEEPGSDDGSSTLPPGVSRHGIESVDRLQASHRRAIDDRSYVFTEWERSRTIRDGNETVVVTRQERMIVESPTVYTHALSRTRATPNRTLRFDRTTYADGTQWHQRTTNGSRVAYNEGLIRTDRDKFAFAATFAIEQYLSDGDAAVTRVTENGDTLYRIRDDDPGEFEQYWSNFTAVAYVEPSGFVRRFTVSHEIERQDSTDVVAYRFAYEKRGNVSTTSPDWLDRAKRQGSGR